VREGEGLGVINFYTLAAGFLTGKYRTPADASKSARGKGTVDKKYLNPRGLRILDALDAVAASTKATPGQVATAWLMQRPGVTSPIASATSHRRSCEELVVATQLKLDAGTIEMLDRASAETTAA
jgi:aryl-alcohol dehydrogenase-like predicted oxidoreductase